MHLHIFAQLCLVINMQNLSTMNEAGTAAVAGLTVTILGYAVYKELSLAIKFF